MKNLLIAAALLAGITSCKKTAGVPDTKTVADSLYGKWSYASRTGGFAGVSEKATDKDKIVAEFDSPGNFKFTDNGNVTSQGSFILEKYKSFLTSKTVNLIVYSNDILNQSISKLTSDSLVLSDEISDGFITVYVRQK